MSIITYIINAVIIAACFILAHLFLKLSIFVVRTIVEKLRLKQIGKVLYFAIPALVAAITYTVNVDNAIAMTIAAVICYLLLFTRD